MKCEVPDGFNRQFPSKTSIVFSAQETKKLFPFVGGGGREEGKRKTLSDVYVCSLFIHRSVSFLSKFAVYILGDISLSIATL